jgi:hypothetical protein
MVSPAFAGLPAARIWLQTCCLKLLAIRVDCLFGRRGVARDGSAHVPGDTFTAAAGLVVSFEQKREATGTLCTLKGAAMVNVRVVVQQPCFGKGARRTGILLVALTGVLLH